MDKRDSATNDLEISVVFFGRPTSGMVTVANRMFGDSSECKQKIGNEDDDIFLLQYSAQKRAINACFVNLTPIFVSTAVRTRYETLTRYRDEFPRNIVLIVFVYERGRFTQEDRRMFEYVLNCLSDRAFRRTALVITGCEDLTDEVKENTVVNFYQNELTAKIACRMEFICCVGFPNMDDVLPRLREPYTKRIKEDQQKMQQLLSGDFVQVSPVLQTDDIVNDISGCSRGFDRFQKIWSSYCNIL